MTSRRCIGGRSANSSTRAMRLATRLRKAGDAEESARVKALPKPSAPAWALNQVYWHARADYDRLIAAGRSPAGASAADARRAPGRSARVHAGAAGAPCDRSWIAPRASWPTPDSPLTDATRQRINVTADALATWGSQPQGYVHGRLDRDIDPPGFAALASLGPPALRLVKSGRGAAERQIPAPAEPAPPRSRPTPADKAAPPASKRTPEPTAAEKAAAKRAAEKAAQEAARAREAEHRRLARALQDAEREVRVRAAARDRAASALSRAAAERARSRRRRSPRSSSSWRPCATRLASAQSAPAPTPRPLRTQAIGHTPTPTRLPRAPAAISNSWRRVDGRRSAPGGRLRADAGRVAEVHRAAP